MSSWNEILERNQKYAETEHQPQPYLSELTGPLPQYFIYSCIDPRVPVEQFLGIKTADALIVRTAGGRVKDNLNDLIFLDTFSQGQTVKDVIVIHHTDCGYTHNTDEALKSTLKSKHPELSHDIDQLSFGTFGSGERLPETVREDLKLINANPFLRQDLKDNAKGYIWDIKTGKLAPVSVGA